MIRPVKYLFLMLLLAGCGQVDKQKNHLNNASSPYLLEHADNPVDWYEWGDEALQKAKKENKPLLISIGYASCHWCHVMEKESFMDTSVARIMNENFVCIKVDREERPDIDNIYMRACQLITGGSGGWPLNAFAMPDGKPFFAGTYYTNKSWKALLADISKAYQEKSDLVVKQADALTKGLVEEELSFQKTDSADISFTKTAYDQLFDTIYKTTDTLNGGLRGAPKFPMPSVSEFLLQYHYFTGDKRALHAATASLSKMAMGGIYDHVGGGFARYATDIKWKVPHFEKMLYDNGQLVSLYAHAYQVTKNEWFKTIMKETIGFVGRELSAPGGGFFSSINADTEDGEGEFYCWTSDEFKKIAGPSQGDLLAEYYNVLDKGNWSKNKNILYATEEPASFAASKKQPAAPFSSLLTNVKSSLLTERNKRARPTIDTKILTSWNAIMIKGYLDAFAATGDQVYLSTALATARFIENKMLGKDGHLFRNFKDGRASIEGFLDDYAWLARAYIRLYQLSFDKHWLDQALQIANYAVANFYDNKSGLFYYTAGAGNGLVVRKMEISDNVIPSSNAMLAGVLYDLSVYFENPRFLEKSRGMLAAVAGKMNALTSYYSQWASLAGLFSYGTYEVAVMGKDAEKSSLDIQLNYLPSCLYLGETDEENLPLLENKLPDKQTLIYVCTNKICKLPVADVDKALKQIMGSR